MYLYKTTKGLVLERENSFQFLDSDWDWLVANDGLFRFLSDQDVCSSNQAKEAVEHHLLAPIGSQEVWACGVTYYDSQMARREESEVAGGGDFYSRVYHADRPEIFFKSTAQRVAGHRQQVRIRSDSTWDVPEPELTLVVSPSGKILGYTVGNDMSSRSIEGENPLYLPQAKTYEQSAGIGPGIFVTEVPVPVQTEIRLEISRHNRSVFTGTTTISSINRKFEDLIACLYRELDFPVGAYVMTGTGIVPEKEFTLHPGDRIEISIEGIGELVQSVVRR